MSPMNISLNVSVMGPCVSECDGYVCDLETKDDPSTFNVIHSSADLARMLLTLVLFIMNGYNRFRKTCRP